MRALVTGGAGFIGSNLVDGLVDAGHEVAVLDNLSTGRRSNLDGAIDRGVRLYEADVREADDVVRAVVESGTEVIFHMAAQVDVRRSVSDPYADMEINVGGTINVLEAARGAGVRRVINTSTGGAVYGEGKIMPAPEEHPIAPEAPYGQSKFAAEGYCGLYARLHGLSTVSLRYSNVYGPRQDPLGEGGVIAIFCGLSHSGGQPVVFGDGLQTRDYVYVGDVVRANLAAAATNATGSINIGTGVESTVLDIVEALAPHAKGPFEPQHQPARPGEVRHSAIDATRAEAELEWRPEVALAEGLDRTLAWLG